MSTTISQVVLLIIAAVAGFSLDLYYKLQNLEKYPEILPHARDTLLVLLSESLDSVPARISAASGILSIDQYSKQKLSRFVHDEQEQVTKYREEYVARRRAGRPRELFKTHDDAGMWIEQACPLKYAWQVLSEEYGDGDLEKHHVHIYKELVYEVDPELPGGDTRDFIHPRHGLTDLSIWKAAVAQLLISIFPHEFLPEILGFNLHFEGVSKETLIASRELRELGFNPFYFLLHICIDNADSGHTAMALHVVLDYMEHLRITNDGHAMQRAWKGVQAGFILSQTLSSRASKIPQDDVGARVIPQNKFESALDGILLSKSMASNRIHCNLRTEIGPRTLSEWLDPDAMASQRWRMEFLNIVSLTRKLVYRGDNTKSRMVQDLSWHGKMFGAFTQSEVQALCDWIDSLPPLRQVYWNFVGRPQRLSGDMFFDQNISADYPVFPSRTALEAATVPANSQLRLETTIRAEIPAWRVDFERLLPLWFAHPALLEGYVVIPSKTATAFGYSVLRFIRAQSDFSVEGPGVAGKDDFRRSPIGLHDIGLEMARSQCLNELTSLKDALEKWPSDFALEMLKLSMYPTDNMAILLGLAKAFVRLHGIVVSSPILSDASRNSLGQIAKREDESLRACLEEIRREGFSTSDFDRAFHWGIMEIESCFLPES
ncbi:hypothetical protein EDB80DRAFT_752945 [Ilyonectria destructans]|nr:hypothetical protein EDB80DRAFT_752945 [Ilyonectria destructans]